MRCRRPLVTVGGELTLDSLELSYNPTSGFYHAPVQAAANGGVLVIDDFGRQQVEPRQFLNRWIVPLESRVDFLTLKTGQKFELPFVVLIVFATNLRAVHARRRGIPPADSVQGVRGEPDRRGVPRNLRALLSRTRYSTTTTCSLTVLLNDYFRARGIPLRGCHPRDLINQALSLAEYRGEPQRLTPDLLRAACDGYFVDRRRARCGVRVSVLQETAQSCALVVGLAAVTVHAADSPPALSVRITSPLGRTGLPGAIRIVAQVSHSPQIALGPVRFFVNDALVGDDAEGRHSPSSGRTRIPSSRREFASKRVTVSETSPPT